MKTLCGYGPTLLAFSGASADSLERDCQSAADHLRAHPEVEIADLADRVQSTRKSLEHRRALVCESRDEAIRQLTTGTAPRTWSAVASRARRVSFVFPGVGEQYPGMARELFERAPVFRAALDRSVLIIERELGEDLGSLLRLSTGRQHVPGALDFRAMLSRSERAGPIRATRIAQPLVFAVEHALVELLGSWGIHPSAVLGYSIGEYVAACVAGVLPFDDALRLVIRRAQLIEGLPPGAMLAVATSPAEVQPWLGEELWVAAENNVMTTVVGGRPEAVAALERRLAGANVACRRVEATHAFHTPLLAPVGETLTALASEAPLSPPRIPCISNVTGAVLTDADATDSTYWARHMCKPVQFAAGIRSLLATDDDSAILEVGPGQGLTSFIRQSAAVPASRRAQTFAALPGPFETVRADTALFAALARLWVTGVDVDWTAFNRALAPARALGDRAEEVLPASRGALPV